jgi:hypothetical protein
VLNEVFARNQRAAVTPWGGYADFVELISPGASAVALGGMALGRSTDGNDRWRFPVGTTISAGQPLLVRCDNSRAATTGVTLALNTGFALGDSSGAVVLLNTAGPPVDWIHYGPQLPDISIGRSSFSRGLVRTMGESLAATPPVRGPEAVQWRSANRGAA